MQQSIRKKLIRISQQHSGIFTAQDIERADLPQKTLRRLLDTGEIILISHDMFQLANADDREMVTPDYIATKKRVCSYDKCPDLLRLEPECMFGEGNANPTLSFTARFFTRPLTINGHSADLGLRRGILKVFLAPYKLAKQEPDYELQKSFTIELTEGSQMRVGVKGSASPTGPSTETTIEAQTSEETKGSGTIYTIRPGGNKQNPHWVLDTPHNCFFLRGKCDGLVLELIQSLQSGVIKWRFTTDRNDWFIDLGPSNHLPPLLRLVARIVTHSMKYVEMTNNYRPTLSHGQWTVEHTNNA